MDAGPPIVKDLLLAGGGHSHALLARMLAMDPVPGLRATLISDVSHAPYSGMLPGYVAGFYTYDEAHIDLRRLCEAAGIRFVRATITRLDPKHKLVYLEGRPPLGYDLLSINVGSVPGRVGVPGAERFAIPSKPVPQLLAAWEGVVAQAARDPARPVRLTVVGAGAGGVELSLCMRTRLGAAAKVTILERGPEILRTHAPRTRALLAGILAARGIEVRVDTAVVSVEEGAVVLATGARLAHDHLLWVTAPSPHGWLAQCGLELTAEGFLAVSGTLQVPGFPEVFAAGDVATIAGAERQKSGVYAVRHAKPLDANIRRFLRGAPLVPFRPQSQYLSIIGTADRSAVGSRGAFAARSPLLWTLKDRIDRRFMRKFSDLGPMSGRAAAARAAPASAADIAGTPLGASAAALAHRAAIRCHGCAAKVGGDVLAGALARARAGLMTAVESDPEAAAAHGIVLGLSRPDDAAALAVPPDQLLLQTVDYLTPLVSDPYLFGRIAATHAASDVFAMGGSPHSLLALVNVPLAAPRPMEEDLFQMLAGILAAAHAMGAALIGGHTTETREPGLGLTVNGLCPRADLKTKSGLVPGDALILTKALGTGTLFAAAMRLTAKGRWLDGAIASMLVPNARAAAILAAAGATALTDVTGFGLAGHLSEMLAASAASATLSLDALPVLEGAEATLGLGVTSTLHEQNRRVSRALGLRATAQAHPRLALLFDPQTSGGLLAGVPSARAAACLEALRAAGLPAAVIGAVTPRVQGEPWIDVS